MQKWTSLILPLFVCLFSVGAQAQVAVVNAATFEPGFPVSPGCWASAFGDFAGVAPAFASNVPLPDTLGFVQVLVNDVPSPMNYVGPLQINFLVPKATPAGNVPLKITFSGTTLYDGSLNVWQISPGLLVLYPADPTKPGAILNEDFTINSQQNPAQRGSAIQVFGVGADFAELPNDGEVAPTDPLIHTTTTPKAYVSVAEATVDFSGLAPGLVNAWQLNVRVPDQPYVSGQVPLVAEVSGVKTNIVSFWVEP
jgi:uncharacterized protein (TIGR03437 family)